MSANDRPAPATTTRPKASTSRVVGLALIAIGLTASITSTVAAVQGQSGQSWQVGGLVVLAVVGWALVGRGRWLSFGLAGASVGAVWIATGVALSTHNHLNGPVVAVAGVVAIVIAAAGAALLRRRAQAAESQR